MTKSDAISRIKQIQNGDGVDRDIFPESMKGEIAKDLWNDATFTYGMEYGAIIALMDAFGITEADL